MITRKIAESFTYFTETIIERNKQITELLNKYNNYYYYILNLQGNNK